MRIRDTGCWIDFKTFVVNYKDLEIWKLAREVVIEIHMITLALPKFELYEEGQQIRRSSKSIKSNIVEGYGRRRYKNEYIKFLVYAQASNDETTDHLETLFETGSLTDKSLNLLGRKLNNFIQSVEKEHQTPKRID